MTQEKIHRLYKLIALALCGLSIILLIIPFGGLTVKDRVGLVLELNIGFHLFYYGLNLAPLTQLGWLKEGSTTKDIAKRGYIAMSYFIIAASLFMAIPVIAESFSKQELYRLTTLITISGVVLGALRLNLELRGKK